MMLKTEQARDGYSSLSAFPMLDAVAEIARSPQVTPQETPQVKRLLSVLKGEMSRREIQDALGLKDRKSLRERYLLPALRGGYIEMVYPDVPSSRNQRYRVGLRGWGE